MSIFREWKYIGYLADTKVAISHLLKAMLIYTSINQRLPLTGYQPYRNLISLIKYNENSSKL